MFIGQQNKQDIWNPQFYKAFSGYATILPFWQRIERQFLDHWPKVEDYNVLAAHLAMRFELQKKKSRYEWEVYHSRTILMRENCWHDFFNNLTWLMWPKLKSAIINRIYRETLNNNAKQRSPCQNLLTHFDECGMVICSDRIELFEAIKQFQWKAFFWETQDLLEHCQAVIIGHGLLEKGLTPYLGMTGKALFLQVTSDYFMLNFDEQAAYLDQQIAEMILDAQYLSSPQDLSPFPLLGWPGWWPGNECESFYENRIYFRESRSRI